MKTIHKFPLEAKKSQTVEMPAGATILSVHEQNSQPTLWALVNTENEPAKRAIYIVTTDEDASPLFDQRFCRFVGTVLLHGGILVVHVFEDVGPNGKDIVR